MATRNTSRPRPISRSSTKRPSSAKSNTSQPPSQPANKHPPVPLWSPWTWDDAQQIYYRARKGPNGKYEYETTSPLSTTTTRESGPKYVIEPKAVLKEAKPNVYAVKEPCYFLEKSAVVLCADLSVYDPKPKVAVKKVQETKGTKVIQEVGQREDVGGVIKAKEWKKSGLVMDKQTEGARRERRSQRREGVTRVYDWRRELDDFSEDEEEEWLVNQQMSKRDKHLRGRSRSRSRGTDW
ncbi:uncharacterized protein PAC_20006 [Phialocephala subalpina]|uniref:Uncharacterized protein n=1 Tax=Phialocephala subalpina TaxID=576137 RepID=A0A1L7XYT1_9HELO|nr:uncharacterized protein PAC_20006 [Phialocephala subalpina]